MRVGFLGIAVWAFLHATTAAEPKAFAPFPTENVIGWAVENLDMIPAANVWTSDHIVVWVKRETIKKTGNTAQAWFVWEAVSAETAKDQGGRSAVLLKEFRCDAGQSRTLAMSVYRGNNRMGGLVDSFDLPSPWVYDRPGMMGEAQRFTACERDFDKELDEAAEYFRQRGR